MYPIAFYQVTPTNAGNPLWMMQLADQRYKWNLTTIEGDFSGSTIDWETLVAEIGTAIGVMVDVSTSFDSRLLQAHEQAFQGFLPMAAGVLLDTVAASTARRVIVLPSQ